MNLKYLFTANFSNGKKIQQTQDDISSRSPGKSAFFDVLEEEKSGNELVSFSLSDKNNNYSVFLDDGRFILNGVIVSGIEPHDKIRNKRLIYFRRNTLTFDPGFLNQPGKDVVFVIGWQGNDEHGRNFQQVVEIN